MQNDNLENMLNIENGEINVNMIKSDEQNDDLQPEIVEAIFDMIDSEEYIVANFIINQLDKEGVLE